MINNYTAKCHLIFGYLLLKSVYARMRVESKTLETLIDLRDIDNRISDFKIARIVQIFHLLSPDRL